ncbi:MAG: HAMP domain-containing protein [Planctomycetales bacterium]|nr:HAMP domain-containing protein [Planctomycetales bacterium]
MHIPLRLIWKLLLINMTTLIVMLMLVAVAVHWLAGSYFMTLMEQYKIDPSEVHRMFLQAVDRYLIIACTVGFIIASLLSLWLNYRLMRPISQLMSSAASISEGDLTRRVDVKGCGEIDQLSLVFNSMAENLERMDKLRKDFVVDVAHELRTPLTNIRGYMEGLRDNVITPDAEVFHSLHEESLRLTGLVEELLQLARADLAKSNLNIQCFDLAELTRQVLKTFAPRFEEKHLQVKNTLSSAILHADKERMTQVVTNLLENALRYTPPGGMVATDLTHAHRRVRLLVSNDIEHVETTTSTSPSIYTTSSTLPLFERFQRGEASRSRKLGGAGLGLAIVKEIVLAHRGEVGYSFEDHRAEFWFELPMQLTNQF